MREGPLSRSAHIAFYILINSVNNVQTRHNFSQQFSNLKRESKTCFVHSVAYKIQSIRDQKSEQKFQANHWQCVFFFDHVWKSSKLKMKIRIGEWKGKEEGMLKKMW